MDLNIILVGEGVQDSCLEMKGLLAINTRQVESQDIICGMSVTRYRIAVCHGFGPFVRPSPDLIALCQIDTMLLTHRSDESSADNKCERLSTNDVRHSRNLNRIISTKGSMWS